MEWTADKVCVSLGKQLPDYNAPGVSDSQLHYTI